ncbi:hypothetical protein [Janthinobacterium sp. RB2R34]|uniref:hypothetical protein n=1 Tax=Janthinobacterium sp. RB2R34 TaxID=3424193 RepID=UPI003F1F66E9
MSTKQIDTDVKTTVVAMQKKSTHYDGALFTIKALQWIVFSPLWCIHPSEGQQRFSTYSNGNGNGALLGLGVAG